MRRKATGSLEQKQKNDFIMEAYPKVCIQLPVYCEPDHVKDLIEKVSKISWPRDSLDIQVLDDSNDETSFFAAQAIAKVRSEQPDLNIQLIHRESREGFKAGALNYGMNKSDAEYFAVFDCDFRPTEDFLQQLMPSFFQGRKVAVVQAAWIYRNPVQHLLTRLQRMLLNFHFFVEQDARWRQNLPLNFNGTAGIWSREAIEAGGGWSSRTVTEDLYLSYLVQMKGWEIVFHTDVQISSELPASLSSFLVQQRRWARGNGQVGRLLWAKIFMSDWNLSQKRDAIIHLLGYGYGGLIAGIYFLMPLWLPLRAKWLESTSFFEPARLFDSGLWLVLMILFFSVYSSRRIFTGENTSVVSRLWNTFFLLITAPTIAVTTIGSYLQGIFIDSDKKVVEFKRTPKSTRYSLLAKRNSLIIGGMTLLFAYSFIIAILQGQYLFALMMFFHGIGSFLLLRTEEPSRNESLMSSKDGALVPNPLKKKIAQKVNSQSLKLREEL